MTKPLIHALAVAIATLPLALPAAAQMRTSAPAGASAVPGDLSVATKVGTILTNSGLIYAPRYVPAHHTEVGVGLGMLTGAMNSAVPLVGATGYMADGLNWGVMLSGESQFGLRQRYMATDKVSFGASYLGRVNLSPGASPTVGDYGATYRLEYLLANGGLDFYFQPELSYYVNAGPAAGIALGADYWVAPSFSLGLGAQTNVALAGSLPPSGRFENRVGGGAKLFASDDAFVFLSGAYLIDRASSLVSVGAGYRFR